MKFVSLLLLLPSLYAPAPPAVTPADWPGWRGADRTDVSKETGLLKSWPDGGPKLLWTFEEAGVGFGGLAVVGDVLYAMGAMGDKEFVYALDTKTQKTIWKTEIGSLLVNNWGDGPRGTPTVDGNVLYCLSGQGNIHCIDRGSGEKKWMVSMTKDLGGQVQSWGYTESPLVDGDLLIVTPGSRGGMAALNKTTGKTEWQCKELTDAAGYSSSIVAEVDGVRQYIRTTMKGIVGVEAKTGKRLWYVDKSGAYRTAVVPTVIYKDGHVYATSGYNAGCDLIKLTKGSDTFKADVVYNNKNMVNHHGGVLLFGDHLYGYSDGKGWVCQDFKTGEIAWSDKTLGKGSLTCADGKLYCYSERGGNCMLVEASPKGWKESGRFKIPKETKVPRKSGQIWTHPVVANGKLYLRDQDLIFCFDVKDEK